jgi:sulfur-carrier protein adenylyltransferase/sulfurtransferase
MTYKTGLDLLEETRTRIKESTAAEINEARVRGDDLIFVDVREQNEWNLGHIPGAVHISRGNLESRIESLVDRHRNVVVYCARGNRSAFAADTLQQMGYSTVVSMSDGWGGWIACEGDVEG